MREFAGVSDLRAGTVGDRVVALGFRCHSGWAVMVVVAGSPRSPEVLGRHRVELVGDSLPRQPYHAVAEDGAPPVLIAAVEKQARRALEDAIRSVPAAVAVGVIGAERRLPDDLDQILGSHARLHAAEGRLFELAVIDAAADAGITAHVVGPDAVVVSPELEGLRSSIGSPWQKDHKWAAAAAMAALGAR